MNTVECIVTKVLTKPYFNYFWCVDVEADSWGNVHTTSLY